MNHFGVRYDHASPPIIVNFEPLSLTPSFGLRSYHASNVVDGCIQPAGDRHALPRRRIRRGNRLRQSQSASQRGIQLSLVRELAPWRGNRRQVGVRGLLGSSCVSRLRSISGNGSGGVSPTLSGRGGRRHPFWQEPLAVYSLVRSRARSGRPCESLGIRPSAIAELLASERFDDASRRRCGRGRCRQSDCHWRRCE